MIWTVCATDDLDERHILRVMERAAREGVSGIEVCHLAIDSFLTYRAFPQLAARRSLARIRGEQAMLRRLCDRAAKLGLRLGMWHHEIEGPEDLLEQLPELRAKDGLIDLEKPLLYEFISGKCAEFFALFPTMDELVLTLTETRYVVAHRPFSETPPSERIRRVLQAVADVTEPLGKRLVIRPFSAVRADELHVRDALRRLRARRVSVMYKTEPFDWNPFLPDEELIGSVKRYEARAETDAGAEYYGQADFPCCYTRYIQRRLDSARRKGARVAVIRVDRGAGHTALGHPVNEANVIAPTQWALDPLRGLDRCRAEWLWQRHGARSARLMNLLERTFEVIQKTLYIDRQSISHRAFPDLEHAKHIQVFALFEETVSLGHMTGHWSMLPTRKTLTHRAILAEKQAAVELARGILREFDRLSATMSPVSREEIRTALLSLEALAQACLSFCRVMAAHTGEMWERPRRATRAFEVERKEFRDLADRIEARHGSDFFRKMPACMRSIADGIAAERAVEVPLRRSLRKRPGLVDYVLCGFAAEGHRLAKRLHTGQTFPFADRFVRATGVGPSEGFAYHLKSLPHRPQRLIVTLAADGAPRPGILRVGDRDLALDPPPSQGLARLEFDLPPRAGKELVIRCSSTTPRPCWVATLELFEPRA